MDSRCWKPDISLLGCEVIGKQGEESTRYQSWRHQLNLCLTYKVKMQLLTCRNIYGYVNIHELVYTHIFPCSVSQECLDATILQQQQEKVVPRSWFLIVFSNKINQDGEKADSRSGVGNKQDCSIL